MLRDYDEIIRIRLKAERMEAGYSQKQLADFTGLDDSMIGKIEVGLRKPDTQTLGILANFYGLSLDYFFGFSAKKELPEIKKNRDERI